MKISLRLNQYLELEKLGIGAFAPLSNFMSETEFQSVCDTMQLPTGDPFPIPVVFDVDRKTAKAAENAQRIELFYLGVLVGEIIPESIYTCNKESVASQIFGTNEKRHPGVQMFYNYGEYFIGGKTTLISRIELDISKYELTPAETKEIFTNLGWHTIVGFQTRNVPHRAHEYLQRVALEHVDGLFIQPLVGQRKIGDYTPEAIIQGYQTFINDFYPKNRVVLGILSTSMRYAGPREAVFHALIRRNYGCTHFIVGRDHAGVGKYYQKYGAHALLRSFASELGIQIMYLHGPYHCNLCGGIVTEHTCPHYTTNHNSIVEISGTLIRQILLGGSKPDERFIRPEVLKSVQNCTLFIDKENYE